MNSACRKRRAERARKLLQRFSILSLPRLVFQDEKDFFLQVPTNRQNNRVYFVQDSVPLHRANQVQNFLKQKLKSRFVKITDWPPKSPDCNPLDYYFWDRVQEESIRR